MKTQDLFPAQAAPTRLADQETVALIHLRRVFMHEIPRLRGIVNVRLMDEIVAKVALGYLAPAFEYEMLLALSAPDHWRPVHAYIPDNNGSPRELRAMLGSVRVDENLFPDGKIVTRWLAIPPKWPLSVNQPDNWYELLFEACFDRSDGADPPYFVSEKIPDAIDIGSNPTIFRQTLLVGT